MQDGAMAAMGNAGFRNMMFSVLAGSNSTNANGSSGGGGGQQQQPQQQQHSTMV
jgi:hypothetical protein